MIFDKDYNKKKFYWGKKPSECVVIAAEIAKKGRALDLGCGEGRNAVYLAQRGFDVECVDISEAGLKKAQVLARLKKVSLEVILSDVRSFKFGKKYDIILSNAALHYLEMEERRELTERIKWFTKNGGLNVISAFIKGRDDSEDKARRTGMRFFKKNELKNYYSGWEIVEYSEKMKLDTSHGKHHYHSIATVIAKKPLSIF